jgi:GT2 family glycosyltransferase
MISVVMPYWQRADILRANVAHYCKLYSGLDIEIVIVDDGSPERAAAPSSPPFAVRIVRLPDKTVAKNPCIPLNAGVAEARGEIIVLTNPEVVHRAPILAAMREHLNEIGPLGYIAAACRGRGWWYCHSTDMPPNEAVGRVPSPPGAGLHFCSMLHRGLFDRAGGFDERYRDGQGYEDNDFLWRLHSAGARFMICDDLVCDHVMCPPAEWPAGGAARNREIFEKTWRRR